MDETIGHIRHFSKLFRYKKYKLKVLRSYIEKSNGKLRPIGAPCPSSKMLYMSILLFLEKGIIRDLGSFQHGFIKGRGVQSAGLETVRRLREGKLPYEFDLKGFFNNVNPKKVVDHIKELFGSPLAD